MTNIGPDVSVIIPCYNMERYLPECLESVLGQSLRNIEALCIDDGSTDRTPELLDGYRDRDGRVRVIHQQNQGVAAARNLGISQARGRYVAFMDPDDLYPDDGVLEKLCTKAAEHGAVMCGGSFSTYDQGSGKVKSRFTGDQRKYTFDTEGFVDHRQYQFDFGYHRFLYRRDFLLENRLSFPPYARYQDPPFFVRAMIAAGSFYAIPDVVYRYREGIQADAAAWPAKKLHDMLRGHLDVLLLSDRHRLCELHALTVRRLEAGNVYTPVMKALGRADTQTLQLLARINAAVRPELLLEANCPRAEEGFLLEELQALLAAYSGAKPPERRLSRLISGAVRCCRDHGCVYTVKRIWKRIVWWRKE